MHVAAALPIDTKLRKREAEPMGRCACTLTGQEAFTLENGSQPAPAIDSQGTEPSAKQKGCDLLKGQNYSRDLDSKKD